MDEFEVNDNWPDEWKADLVRWTPKHDMPSVSIAGFEFPLSAGDETVTPRAVLATYLEARPGTEIEAVDVDAPAGVSEEAGDGDPTEVDPGSGDGAGAGSGDGSGSGDAASGADPDDVPFE